MRLTWPQIVHAPRARRRLRHRPGAQLVRPPVEILTQERSKRSAINAVGNQMEEISPARGRELERNILFVNGVGVPGEFFFAITRYDGAHNRSPIPRHLPDVPLDPFRPFYHATETLPRKISRTENGFHPTQSFRSRPGRCDCPPRRIRPGSVPVTNSYMSAS